MTNDFDSAIATFLLSRTEITSVVGTNVYPDEAHQGTQYPYITYAMIGGEEIYNLTGGDNISYQMVQFVIYASKSSDRALLREGLRNILSGKGLSLLTYTGGSVTLLSCFLVNGGKNFYTSARDGSEIGIYERRMTFKMCFKQSVPTL